MLLHYGFTGQSVVSCGNSEDMMPNCDHEEADTRIVVHILHALEHGATTVQVRTVDTDVIAILVGAYHNLIVTNPAAEIWIAFGMGKNFSFYNIGSICSSLGDHKARALPVFHAFTGCDQTSSFVGKGKKSGWQAWQAYDEVTQAFVAIASTPFQLISVESPTFKLLERYTVILYDKASASSSVNETRMTLFCHRSCAMEKLPPTQVTLRPIQQSLIHFVIFILTVSYNGTDFYPLHKQDALLQHALRVIYQAGVWCTSHQALQSLPSPETFAWTKVCGKNGYRPLWITIPEVSCTCRQLIRCACKGNCTSCKCGKASLNCTRVCKCKCAK